MKVFVLDASVALAWLVDRAPAPLALRVRQRLEQGARAIVPALWQWEIANAFVIAERRGMLTFSDTAEILRKFEFTLGELIEIKSERVSPRQVIAAAREYHLTAYGAAYLSLARHEKLPIATLDRALADAATRAGIHVLQ
jgi:predicted nucleic acid-binding protein